VIDHIVYGVPRRLAQAVGWFAGLTGAQPARGGSHEGMGTANFLIGLGAGAYLEIIGPDPDQPQPVGGRWFGIDRLTAPRIVTRSIRTLTSTARWRQREPWATTRPADNHDPAVRRRRRLQWRLMPPQIELNDGLVPFLIDWGSTRTRRAVTSLAFG
jgi:hypothetical protein